MGRVTAAAELAAELAAIPIMHPGKGAKIRISGGNPFGPPNQREPCADLISWPCSDSYSSLVECYLNCTVVPPSIYVHVYVSNSYNLS